MADDKTPAPPAAPAAAPAAPAQEPPAAEVDWVSRAGTIFMVVALAGLSVVLLDVALKGRLLGPLIARLPGPRPAEEGGGDAPGNPGE